MPYKDKEKQREAQRASHERNRDKIREADRIKKEQIKSEVRKHKDKPCADCKQSYPYYVMQFDHVRGIKEGDISRFVANRQLAKALEEIKKCDVVCANCHAIRSFERIPKGQNHPSFIHSIVV